MAGAQVHGAAKSGWNGRVFPSQAGPYPDPRLMTLFPRRRATALAVTGLGGFAMAGVPRTSHKPPRWTKVPVEILVVLCPVVGIAPELTVAPLLAVAAAATLQTPLPEADFGLLHAFESELQSALQLAGMNDSKIHECRIQERESALASMEAYIGKLKVPTGSLHASSSTAAPPRASSNTNSRWTPTSS